jgi:murein DD-endopeptidase MepM/ murein hydrolase activator NlpD
VLHGVASGEPLHFERVGSGRAYWALAAIALDAPESVLVSVTIDDASARTDTLAIWIPVAPRTSAAEALQPPPEFRQPPDSAVAARVASERALAAGARRHSHDTPRLWRDPFRWPLQGRKTSGFGASRRWQAGSDSRHDGIDIAGAAGTPVRAANRGVVALVAELYYGGITVLVDHGGGLVTSYQHLSLASVAVGDTVARGAMVGRVGATGRVTGPHLHWGASYGAVVVDPVSLLALQVPS